MSLATGQSRRPGAIGDAVRFRWRCILLGLIFGALLGLGLAVLQPAQFTVSTSVLVNPVVGNPYTPEDGGDELTSLESEARIVTSDVVIVDAARALGLDPESPLLREGAEVTVPPNTQILQITLTGRDASRVQSGARALAHSYLDFRRQNAVDVVSDRASRIEAEIDRTLQGMQRAEQAGLSGPEAQRPVQERLADALQTDLFNLRTELSEAQSLPTDPGRVMSPARVPTDSADTRRLILLLAGLVGGGLLGLLIALGRERSKDMVRRASDLSDLGVPVLAELDQQDAGPGGKVTYADEGLRRLRVEILTAVRPPASLLVASSREDAEVAALSVHLSTGLASVDLHTVLVDAASQSARDRGPFGLSGRDGLSEVLLREADCFEVLAAVGERLSVLPAGRAPDRASELYLTPLLSQTLRRLQSASDFVVVQGPPLASADGESLASQVNAVVVLARRHQTTYRDLQRALMTVERSEAKLAGVVVVGERRARRGSRPGNGRVAGPLGATRTRPDGKPRRAVQVAGGRSTGARVSETEHRPSVRGSSPASLRQRSP